jgi:DNA-binding beta-propeller fold protein YncE
MVVAAIHVGLIPDGIAVSPGTDTAYVASADDFTVSVIAPCRNEEPTSLSVRDAESAGLGTA